MSAMIRARQHARVGRLPSRTRLTTMRHGCGGPSARQQWIVTRPQTRGLEIVTEKRNELYPAITQDHHATWTWTIESGTALENTRRVYAVHSGYATQGDARAAAKARLAELVAAKAAAASGDSSMDARSQPTATGAEPYEPAASAPAPFPDWGVYAAARSSRCLPTRSSAR